MTSSAFVLIGICTGLRSALEYLCVAFLAHVPQALRAPALWCRHPGFLEAHSSPLACGCDRDAVAAAMKEIVVVCLAIDAETGAIDRAAPFVVIPYQRPHRGGVYDNEPEWDDEKRDWIFGKRVDDA
jgi:hypothetical protein